MHSRKIGSKMPGLTVSYSSKNGQRGIKSLRYLRIRLRGFYTVSPFVILFFPCLTMFACRPVELLALTSFFVPIIDACST